MACVEMELPRHPEGSQGSGLEGDGSLGKNSKKAAVQPGKDGTQAWTGGNTSGGGGRVLGIDQGDVYGDWLG